MKYARKRTRRARRAGEMIANPSRGNVDLRQDEHLYVTCGPPMGQEAFAENPLSQSAMLALGIGAVAVLGLGAYFLFKPKTAAAGSAPDILTSGPYNVVQPGQMFKSGQIYLLSAPPVPEQTLAATTASLSSLGLTVLQSWDVNQVPANWPKSDSDLNEWRMVVSYTGPSLNINFQNGGHVFTTHGQ